MDAIRWMAGLLMVAGVAPGPPGDDARTAPRVYLNHPTARTATLLGVYGAIERLNQPWCREILADFPGWPGRAIVAQLESDGISLAEYVRARLWFVDGSDRDECLKAGPTAAFTGVGHKVVYICPKRVARLAENTKALELLVIHEILHTLGLPENPPSSGEITRQVRRRCG